MILGSLFPIASPEDTRRLLVIVPLGRVSDRQLTAVRRALNEVYNLRVDFDPGQALPRTAYYPPRKRYRADRIIALLAKRSRGDKILGLTGVDISTTAHGRKDWGVVGLGFLGGRSAVVSSFRLKGDLAKLGDVAVHEVGHSLGRNHCPTPGCTMQDAQGKIRKIGAGLCGPCRRQLEPWLR